ncbi:ribonuclease J [Dehalogenimonas etheniformans]|uniref:ribonuclease J n=1 Tax=Dehalogenimonas etheniformans TaxID=1536648 RepID=UPI0021F6E08E|nr:ribonuclease J [Dehalogenimonas etheniformans]
MPLGGLGEIGKNMMVVEYDDDIIIIDCGLMFPEEDMPGIDLVIPDISYLQERKDRILGIVITHGHEDHIGALPYILPQLNVPIYCAPLPQGLIQVKLKESHVHNAKIHAVKPGERIDLGPFNIEFISMCHSIPDSAGLVIRTPVGTIVHSGDFKLDYTPVDCRPTDLGRLGQIGAEGVLLLMADSTHVELPGYTPSEKVVGETISTIMGAAKGRVLVTTFASLVSRIQQVMDAAVLYNRKVFIAGRGMNDIVKMALKMGYLRAPDGLIGELSEMHRLPPNRIAMVTTGSQGEPTSALVRIANREHREVQIKHGDTVIISASPIPGNESVVSKTIDSLFKQGAMVYYDRIAKVHVHGHASQEELKLLQSLIRPQYFVPVHGEYRHLKLHAQLAEGMGVDPENIFILEDGDILELSSNGGRVTGRVPSSNVYVDGVSVGDINGVVLRNRKMLSQDGIVVAIITLDAATGQMAVRPDIVSRGFVDPEAGRALLDESKDIVSRMFAEEKQRISDSAVINTRVRDVLSKFYYDRTRRRPMVLPVLVTV